MFTNWLTGTTGGAAAATNQNSAENRSGPPNSNPPNNAGNSGNGHILMSTPPDVILEVGTVPSTVRFVAHSIVLGMHSGYLRSAIRLDERTTTTSNAASPDFVLYLSNVTAEQFAPLLTYMYTGYLDLNVENIFGVLLATHVLHMPRALEICRTFLARAQTEGYLGARLNSLNVANPNTTPSSNNTGSAKIIRPIPSKPTLPNFGFLPALPPATTMALVQQQQQQQQQQLLPPAQLLVNFKGLQRQTEHGGYPPPMLASEHTERQQQRATSEEIDVDQESTRASSEVDDTIKDSNKKHDEDDDEDEEVFIDSSNTDTDNDESEVIIECRSKATAPQKRAEVLKTTHIEQTKHIKKSESKATAKQQNRNSSSSSSSTNTRRDKRRTLSKQRSSSGLQIAKAPIPASQLDANEGSKVIIDVASCDGPVRFRRILNTAYGHKPEDFATQLPERSQQSVSYSFHQQMARTINQQRQQMQQQSGGEESENSESSGGSKAANKAAANASTEIYVCVYCKHTFKSQYCYQKHAKRHLNPLSLSTAERCAEKSTLNPTYNAAQFPHTTSTLPIPLAASKQSATEMLRREVRPLDMNVQYYPCKTCGSKFPSYYFVHKHRKMCHADEEAAAAKDTMPQGSVNTTNAEGGHINQREEKQESSTEVGDNDGNNSDERTEYEAKNEN